MSWEWEDYGDEYDPGKGRQQDFGDEVKPLPGSYLAEVAEGIELKYNDRSKKYTIWVPLVLRQALEDKRGNGAKEAIGAKVTDFISPGYDFTMKRLGFLIYCSKYRADFAKKYAGIPAYGEEAFDQFLMDVKRYLPSTRVCVNLAMSEGTKKPMCNVKSYWRHTTAAALGSTDERPGWTA
jgi:hypothetical protein